VRGEVPRGAEIQSRALHATRVPLADRASFINPGDEIVPGIQAVDAAGHSPGMLAFLIASGGKRLLNWADTCGPLCGVGAAAGYPFRC